MKSLGLVGLRRVGSVALVAGVVAVGCVSVENERKLELAVGTRCTLNSDCTDPNVCVFGICHQQCVTSADCDHEERCVKGEHTGTNVCQLATEAKCATTSDCPGTQVCGVDGECRDPCSNTAECLTGQVCTQGTCADQGEVDPETGQLPADPEHVGEGQPCSLNSDCPGDLACVDNACTVQCNQDKDCNPGDTCVDHRCTHTGLPPGAECMVTSDCELGNLCTAGTCQPGCVTDAGCPSGARCFAAQCTTPILDAAFAPDGIAANGNSIFVLYQDEIIQCPLAGCTAATAVDLFTLPYGSLATNEILQFMPPGELRELLSSKPSVERPRGFGPMKPMGGFPVTAQRPKILVDGDVVVALNPNSSTGSGLDMMGACLDAGCATYVEFEMPFRANAAALRPDPSQSGVYIYEIGDEGFGPELVRCFFDATSASCSTDYFTSLGKGAEPLSIAVVPGATSFDDIMYVGWADGTIEEFKVSNCGKGCSSDTLASIVDSLGFPDPLTNLVVSGTDLYWLTGRAMPSQVSNHMEVQRCALANCQPQSIFTSNEVLIPFPPDQNYMPAFTLGGGFLFVTDDGNVWRETTPP